MKSGDDKLIEYLNLDELNLEHGCIIRLSDFPEFDVEEFFETFPYLKDEYIYLRNSNLLIDKQAAKSIKKDVKIGSFSMGEILTLAEYGILDNPNIKCDLVLDGRIDIEDFENFPEFVRELGTKYDSVDRIKVGKAREIDFDELRWTDEETIDFFSKIEELDLDFCKIDKLREKIKKIPELAKKMIFLDTRNGSFKRIVNIDNARGILNNESYGKYYVEDKSDSEFWRKLLILMKNNSNLSFGIEIDNIGDIPIEFLEKALNIETNMQISINHKGNHSQQKEGYDIYETFMIRKHVEELIKGIDPNASDLEKFSEVYKRVCSLISYDYEAAYPSGEEEEYAEKNKTASRNLKNGLLERKCVCAGYADILRNALAMLGVEAQYVQGAMVRDPVSKEEYEREKEGKYKFSTIYEQTEDEVCTCEYHAWVKVKINGVWYNCDPTWDNDIADGRIPKFCLLSDKTISTCTPGITRKEIEGPECSIDYPREEIEEEFSEKEQSILDKIIVAFKKLGSYGMFFDRRTKMLPPSKSHETEYNFATSKKASNSIKEKLPSWDLRNYPDSQYKNIVHEYEKLNKNIDEQGRNGGIDDDRR